MRRLLLIPLVLILLLATACGTTATKGDNDRQKETMERVRHQRPIPEVSYSQTYDTIIKWMERWNVQDKVSYVYLMADNGQLIGYYVAQGRPVSTCTFLTAPVEIVGRHDSGKLAIPAPALDGVYYGDCGESSYYFFTADTDAFVEIGGGIKFFVTDQPLSVEVEQLRIE